MSYSAGRQAYSYNQLNLPLGSEYTGGDIQRPQFACLVLSDFFNRILRLKALLQVSHRRGSSREYT